MLSYMRRVASKKRRMAAAPTMALLPADVSSSTCAVNALANSAAVARPMMSTQPLPGVALGLDMDQLSVMAPKSSDTSKGCGTLCRAPSGVDAAPGRHLDAL